MLLSTEPGEKSPLLPFVKGGNWAESIGKSSFEKGGFKQHCPVRKLHVVARGKKFGPPCNRCFDEDPKCRFVILSEAKDLVFLRFFGRFAPSE
jgi:hypothetical protein